MAFGTSLTTLGYELSLQKNNKGAVTFLILLFIMAMLGIIRTGLNIMEIETAAAARRAQPNGLIWMNVVLGLFAIALNIFFLAAKDRESQTAGYVSAPSIVAGLRMRQ
jgi:hypothetical protein